MTKKPSVKKTLILQFSLLLTICAIVLCLISIPVVSHIAAEKQHDKIITNLNTANAMVINSVNNIVLTNSSLSKNTDVISILTGYSEKDAVEQLAADTALYNILYSAWYKTTDISDIKFYVDGKLYSSASNAVFDTGHISASPWFKSLQTSSDMLIVSDFSEDFLNTQRSMNNSVAVCSRIEYSGDILGYIKTSLSTDYIYSRILNPLCHPASSEIFLIDNATKKYIGTIGTFPDAEIDSILHEISSKYSGYITTSVNGTKYRILYSELNNHGFRCVEAIKTSELYRLTPSVFAILLLSIFSILILIAIGAFFIICRTSDSLKYSLSALSPERKNFSELSEITEAVDTLSKKNSMLSKQYNQIKHENNLLNLSAFSTRINPHFLYNTLDTIIWNLDVLDNMETARLLSSLSTFYRGLLKTSSFVCELEDEIKVATLYMTLQKSCFNSAFNYSINIPSEISKLYIPSFILQPLIENSIIHGFKNKKYNLMLTISAELSDNHLILILNDNGHGIDAFTLNRLNNNETPSSNHEGIKNVRNRIKLICGDEYDLHFYSEYTSETIVKITLPIAYDMNDFNINL